MDNILKKEICLENIGSNFLAIFLIILGTVLSQSLPKLKLIALISYITGWVWFIMNDYSALRNKDNETKQTNAYVSIIIPIMGICIFSYIGNKGPNINKWLGLMILVYTGIWIYYLYVKSLDHDNKPMMECIIINFAGLVLLLMGFVCLFWLTKIPYLFAIFITMGWGLLAIGNSVPLMT